MADEKLVRLRHTTTGAVVQVREDKALGSEWEPADKKPATAKASTAKAK